MKKVGKTLIKFDIKAFRFKLAPLTRGGAVW